MNDNDYKVYKVLKCLELIDSLIEDCAVKILDTNDECSFDEAFPAIIEFIEKVGYNYEGNKLYDVGNKIYDVGKKFYYVDDNIIFEDESEMVKVKCIAIVEKLYEREIWPFEG